MVNKIAGNRFEAELCRILADHGFWAHNLAQSQAGQPADIIAVRNGRAALIDCKLCKGRYFSFARIEPNQESAMERWKACGNGGCWFALKGQDGGIYMISYTDIKAWRKHGLHTICLTSNTCLTDWVGSWDLAEVRHAD